MKFFSGLFSWPAWLFLAALFFLFSPAIFSSDVLGFRDTFHFYFPLWTYADRLDGLDRWFPMWNHRDGIGVSMIGEPTSMTFYPLRAILLIPVASLTQRIGAFLLVHCLIGYLGWFAAGKRVGHGVMASHLGAIAYVLSGPVFFGVFNPPFLIGACWLPLAMGFLSEILGLHRCTIDDVGSKQWAAAKLGIVLALIVLGGDAQCAFHIAMLAVGSWFFLCLVSRRRNKLFPNNLRGESKLRQRLTDSWNPFTIASQLIFALVLAMLLASIQIAPTAHWLKLSNRTADLDREASSHVHAGQESTSGAVSRGLFSSETSSNQRKEFELRPLDTLTVFFPNVLGGFAPVNSRWVSLFEEPRRVWIPSLHFGSSLGLWLCAAFWIGLQKPLKISRSLPSFETFWPLAIAMIALWSSTSIGLYDLWSTILPLYSQFRYPAKWMIFVVWGIAFFVSGAITTEMESYHSEEQTSSTNATQRFEVFLAALSKLHFFWGCGACVLLAIYLGLAWIPRWRESFADALTKQPVDPWCGMVDAGHAIAGIGFCGLTSVLLATFACVGFRLVRIHGNVDNANRRHRVVKLTSLLIVLVVIELTIANARSLAYVDSNKIAQAVAGVESRFHSGESKEIRRWDFGQLAIPVWSNDQVSIPQTVLSMEESATRQIEHQLGKLHLLHGGDSSLSQLRNLDAFFTLKPRMMQAVRNSESGHWQTSIEALKEATSSESLIAVAAKPRLDISHVILNNRMIQFDYEASQPCVFTMPVIQDGGWKIVQSLSRVQLAKGGDDRIRIKMIDTEGTVTLRYETPGLRIGGTFTLIGLLTLGFVMAKHWPRWFGAVVCERLG